MSSSQGGRELVQRELLAHQRMTEVMRCLGSASVKVNKDELLAMSEEKFQAYMAGLAKAKHGAKPVVRPASTFAGLLRE